jgi:predicted SAM-dependent methyltransferase
MTTQGANVEAMRINGQPLIRPFWDYARIRKLYSQFARGSRLQFRPELRADRYLNVGCGFNTNNNMVNLDYVWHRGVDICWDVTKRLPWQDGTMKGVFTEHCLEHIPFDACAFAITEFRRILQPGASVRIVVPDGELYIDLYRKAKAGESIEFPYQAPREVTPMMCVNRIFQEFTHVFIYDADTLGLLLRRAGFVDIKRETYLHGRDATLLLDTKARAVESLYMEASVPV